jgi:hypothetical protein
MRLLLQIGVFAGFAGVVMGYLDRDVLTVCINGFFLILNTMLLMNRE